jgi:hypothetical protein
MLVTSRHQQAKPSTGSGPRPQVHSPSKNPRRGGWIARLGALALLLGGASVPVQSQEPPAEPAPLPAPPEVPPDKVDPGPPIGAPDGQEDLTDQLSPSRGVIEPPADGDPHLVKPPPDQGTARTPVIPPPGTPEGH